MTEHTPTPWAVHVEDGEVYIVEADPRFGTPLRGGRWICHMGPQEKMDGEDQANLDFMLRATHAFADLLSLVDDLARRVEAEEVLLVDSSGARLDSIFIDRANSALSKARYAGTLDPDKSGSSR